jgi:hypothetical protein
MVLFTAQAAFPPLHLLPEGYPCRSSGEGYAPDIFRYGHFMVKVKTLSSRKLRPKKKTCLAGSLPDLDRLGPDAQERRQSQNEAHQSIQSEKGMV